MSSFMVVYLFVVLVISCVYRGVWGFAVNKVVENKGYSENWFWWGFFFGLIALIVALTKPDCHSMHYYSEGSDDYESPLSAAARDYESPLLAARAQEEHAQMMAAGGWQCTCGKVNPSYVGTCGCGISRESALEERRQQDAEEERSEKLAKYKEYKEMLDAGIISQEEFDAKKEEYIDA